jgi:hypothetical protein
VIAQPFACRFNVTMSEIRVSGLQDKWPRRITRYLTPLDFEQQADNALQDLLSAFERMPRPIQFN